MYKKQNRNRKLQTITLSQKAIDFIKIYAEKNQLPKSRLIDLIILNFKNHKTYLELCHE